MQYNGPLVGLGIDVFQRGNPAAHQMEYTAQVQETAILLKPTISPLLAFSPGSAQCELSNRKPRQALLHALSRPSCGTARIFCRKNTFMIFRVLNVLQWGAGSEVGCGACAEIDALGLAHQ